MSGSPIQSTSQTSANEESGTTTEEACCLLCKHMGGEFACINAIPEYVSENVDKVSLDEICVQISDILSDNRMSMSAGNIKKHLREHLCEKKIVLNGILHDLRGLMQAAIQHSVVVNEETNQSSIDHKACALYLDTVKQVVALYRSV